MFLVALSEYDQVLVESDNEVCIHGHLTICKKNNEIVGLAYILQIWLKWSLSWSELQTVMPVFSGYSGFLHQ